MLKTCSDCKVYEKEVYDKSNPRAPDSITHKKGEKVPTKSLNEGISNDIVNRNDEKSNALKHTSQLNMNNVDLPKIKVKSDGGAVDEISPLNIALGISTAGIKAAEQIKLKHKEYDNLKAKSNGDATKIGVSPVISEQIKLKHTENDDHGNTKTSNNISPQPESKSVHSIEVGNIPVSLQRKSVTTVPVSTDDNNQRTGKTLQLSKAHLSSKQAINEFIGDVLYRFNYTAGYHGHNEEGDSAGNKKGGYFIVGRDNIKRGVIYVADSRGFVPVVKYEKVSPAEAPHEDTEKNAGLRGYEFEWFHKGKSKVDGASIKQNVR